MTHPAAPLLLLGGAGTGKTHVLVERFAHLAAHGLAPARILVLAPTPAGADTLRLALEDRLEGGYEELCVFAPHELAAKLLRDEPLESGLDPWTVPATAADRVAMLLERVDELTVRRHDFRGRPAALVGGFVERIDALKAQGASAADFAAWAQRLGADDADAQARAAREREFAEVYAAHDRMLAERGTPDLGDLLLGAIALLAHRPQARERIVGRFRALLVDDVHELGWAAMELVRLIGGHGHLTVAGDDDQAVERPRGASTKNLRDFANEHPDGLLIRLEQSHRCPERILTAARAVVLPNPDRIGKELLPAPGRTGVGDVRFWHCANERAQAQSAAAEIERLIAREAVAPERVAVLVRSVETEGQAVAVALEERAVPYRVVGAAAFFERAEVRDVLAWLRLLADPTDAGAVVRALARPPVELRQLDLARCVQIARRRKLDMVSGLRAATESPQVTPEARERILGFLRLHREAVATFDSARPDLFVHLLVERLGLRRQQLFAAQADVVERLVNLARMGELAASFTRRAPQATPREFAGYIAAVAEAGLPEQEAVADAHPRAVQILTMRQARGLEFDHAFVLGLQATRMPGARRRAMEPIPDELLREPLPPDSRSTHVAEMRRTLHVAMTRARESLTLAYADPGPPSPFAEEARAAVGGRWEDREEELFGPAETLHSTFRMMRDELLDQVQIVGGRLGELRFDTDLDVSHAVVRLMELIKLSALLRLQSPPTQSVRDALGDVNQRLLSAVTTEQRDIFQTSALDDLLLDAERGERQRAQTVARRSEPSLEAFLPTRGDGLVLSASDIDTYRTCPLKYKFARVFRIPQEPTLNQRFGILVHQVLERWHAGGAAGGLMEMHNLLDAGWRRGGFGDSEEERQLRGKAASALGRYLERCRDESGEPVWFERSFSFKLGPHVLRGRVDRVDKLPEGGYELIDYKTGRPKSASALREDVQLSLYAVGAREAWDLEAAQQAYLYVLDDEKVQVPTEEIDPHWISETVFEVAEGILGQGFEPQPSYSACSMCDYRIACPAAEK
ncbi:ATP-dependent DNA helicase Rep [Capillimicrobium parvum]|uniref:DNA 3'-5' helicase n=1 Tax=Capillimicrobium parvum TaxID=2884022 RepID=A0A9E6Y2L2_9ACTN|nr:ATP-dependent DNA helicase Rep [Capillimicrobium parvum]